MLHMNAYIKVKFMHYVTSNIFRLLIIILFVGCITLLSTTTNLSYFNFIYYALLHPYLLLFFFLPIIFYSCVRLTEDIVQNESLMLYVKSKKELFNVCAGTIFRVVNHVFIYFIIAILLCANLFANRFDLFGRDPNYNEILNVVGLLFNFIKLYIFTIALSTIITSIVISKTRAKILYLIIIYLSLMSMLNYIEFNNIFAILLPYRYIGVAYIFDGFNQNLIFSTIYIVFLLLISILMLKKMVSLKERSLWSVLFGMIFPSFYQNIKKL